MAEARTLSPEAEARLWKWASIGMGALGLVGFALSFATVSKAMEPSFGRLAFLVPLAIDLAILVFTAMDLLMAYKAIRTPWLRYIPWGLTAVTIYLNVADATDFKGAVAHATLPALWVIGVEVAGGAARKIYGIDMAAVDLERMDKIRGSRWLLAPLSSARMWRRMILHEQTSYRRAVGHWEAEEIARTGLLMRHGRWWRFRQNARLERIYLKHGRLDDLPGLPPLPGVPPRPVASLAPVASTAPDGSTAPAETPDASLAPVGSAAPDASVAPDVDPPRMRAVPPPEPPDREPAPVEEQVAAWQGTVPVSGFDPDDDGHVQSELGLTPAGIDMNGSGDHPVKDTPWPVRPPGRRTTTVRQPGRPR